MKKADFHVTDLQVGQSRYASRLPVLTQTTGTLAAVILTELLFALVHRFTSNLWMMENF